MVVLHLLEARGLVDTSASSISFNLEVDRSLGELLGYLITGTVIAGLVTLARREDGDRLLFFAAGVFGLALADDLFAIHEAAGRFIATRRAGVTIDALDPAEIGQLLYFGVVAIAVLAGWRRLQAGASERSRAVARGLGGFLIVFGGFAAGIDFLHELVRTRTTALELLFVPLEDGGELVVLALIASFVFARIIETDGLRVDGDPLVLADELPIDLRESAIANEPRHDPSSV